MPAEFRFEMFGRPCGPWRASRDEAMRDAVDAGEAEWDEVHRVHFLNAGAELAPREIWDGGSSLPEAPPVSVRSRPGRRRW